MAAVTSSNHDERSRSFGQGAAADQVFDRAGPLRRTLAIEYDDHNLKGLPGPKIGVRMAADQASGRGR